MRSGWLRRGLAIGAVVGAVLGLVACDPPDGRDLAVVIADPPASVAEGASVSVAVEVANVGTAPASGTILNVTAPLGVGFQVGGLASCGAGRYVDLLDQVVVTCPVGTVPAGASIDVEVTLTGEVVGAEGRVTVSASSTGGGEPSADGAPHVVGFPFEVDQRDGVDLHVEGGGLDRPVVAPATGPSLTTVVNRGSRAAGPVTVTQTLSGPVTVDGAPTLARADGGATGSCTQSGLTVTCTTGAHEVAPYESADDRWLLSVTVATSASFPAGFTVTHAASSPEPEPTPDRWPATATVQGRAADLHLVLDGPSDVAVGSTFEVTVDETSHAFWGPYYAFDVPATMRLDSPCQGTGSFTCVVSSPVTTFQLTALAVGGPEDLSASFQAEGIPAASGTLPVEVVDPAVTSDVHPSSTPPDFGLLGESFTVPAEVRTAGPTPHQGVVVTADAPPGSVVHGAVWGDLRLPCDVDGRTATCPVGDVPGHSQVPVELILTSERPGPAPVGFAVSSATEQDVPDPYADSTTVEVPIRSPFVDLEVTATAPTAPAVEGNGYDVTYRTSNLGSDPATGVVLTVVVPEGSSTNGTPSACTSVGRVVTCPLGTIEPGQTRLTIVRTWAGPPGATSFEAAVTGDQPEPDPDPHPNTASTPVDPLAPHGDLVIELPTTSGPHVVGAQAGFPVVVRNDGPSMVPNVHWRIVVPDGWRLDSVGGNHGHLCTVVGNVAECGPRPQLWLTRLSLLVRATPLEVRSDGVLTATVWGDLPDPDPTSNSDELGLSSTPVSVDLGLAAWGANVDVFVPGQTGTRSFRVTNHGPATASDVVVTGTVPSEATITTVAGSLTTTVCEWDDHSFSCIVPTLVRDAGTNVQLTMAWADVAGPLTYELAATASEPEVDPDVEPSTLSHTVIASSQPVGIRGVVRGPDGSPVAGAVVRLYAETDTFLPSARVDTAADGSFSVPRNLGTSYRVSITPPAGSGWPAEWYQDVATRGAATWLALTTTTPLHVIEVSLG